MRLLLAAIFLAACAHDVRAHYPSNAPPGETGCVTVVLTRAAEAYIAVDGTLLVDGANTKRVTIDGLPSGFVDLSIAIGDGEKSSQVWVEAGRNTVVPMPSPASSSGDSIRNMVLSLVAMLAYAYLR